MPKMDKQILQMRYRLLDQVTDQSLKENEEQWKKWNNHKNALTKVAEALKTLPKELSVNCMVPIGKRAFMKGKLIHTNEILVSLGIEYFGKYSASEAMSVCERRIQNAENMLKDLNAERDLLEMRRIVPFGADAFGDTESKDILEQWDEAEINEWRAKHREREKEYHQKLSKERLDEKKSVETEEDLFRRLDELEIEEELADEYNRLNEEDAEEDGDYSEDSESSEENVREMLEQELQKLEDIRMRKDTNITVKRKSVFFADPKIMDDEDRKSEHDNEDIVEPLTIEFSHSEYKAIEKDDGEAIETPADIYKMFLTRKSILKRPSTEVIPDQIVALPKEFSSDEEEEDGFPKPSAYENVVKNIKEKNINVSTDVASTRKDNAKPVSKFKRERRNRK